MVFRVYVEKRTELAEEAVSLAKELTQFVGIQGLENVRIINRYDVEGISQELFETAVKNVFSEPQLDLTSDTLTAGEDDLVFAVEFLPGQFDQRADSAAQCIQLISCGEKPLVRTAKVYILSGNLTDKDREAVKKYVINPVESRLADMALPETLVQQYEIPESVAVLEGFIDLEEDGLKEFISQYGLAMDLGDITMCRDYFKGEKRNPTITEIKMIDTYWSDHCRHTTFLTTIDKISTEDKTLQKAFDRYLETRKELGRTKPVNLMDMATVAAKYLVKTGKLTDLDVSDEINACTVKIKVNVDGEDQDYLLLFKNETHNHPTEIEPFGGAATCIGGAIRDPLSGRAYVYGAMRVTGAGDPLKPVSETIPGKLPQRKIVQTAAAGYSSYGNQIGLATGIVDEIYHPGYVAKRMEIGAVVGATPAGHVRREVPADGDVVILLGGRTGRDGCGGATGSSKSHTVQSIEKCGAEVQKGNAPEERKLQRLFRNPDASSLIKRCNDFGAGGVSVAVGELADGLHINLNKVPKKYEGLDGTELAISESQERMAVVVEAKDADKFCQLAKEENLESTIVATVTEEPRLVMEWNGVNIVDISREFLNSNGAEKHISIEIEEPKAFDKEIPADFAKGVMDVVSDLNCCSHRGLSERFDSTIGAGSVMMPFGGKRQRTPVQAMVNKVSLVKGETEDCSLMAWGYNPFISEASPYHGAYLAVVDSVAKLVATGASFDKVYLTFQEYFKKPGTDGKRWGQPTAAILGSLDAQLDLGIGSIGGKDSMSGTFENIDVPPTLVSFAVTMDKIPNMVSNDFKTSGHKVVILKPEVNAETNLPVAESLIANMNAVTELMRSGAVVACYTPGLGGVIEAVYKCAAGNNLGFAFDDNLSMEDIFGYNYGAFIMELAEGQAVPAGAVVLGTITDNGALTYKGQSVATADAEDAYEAKLESVYPTKAGVIKTYDKISYTAKSPASPAIKVAKPKVLIPVFPGTNCEYDSARAVTRAGAEAEIFVINNLSPEAVAQSASEFANKISKSQAIFIPGGFSGGDEPDGSGKFITAFFRNPAIKDSVHEMLNNRDGLMLGICNGFQALIKLGLVPYGEIRDTDENCPTLTFNTIGRHQSKLVRTRVASSNSPWLTKVNVGDVITVPISHGEGRFYAPESVVKELIANGQVATQYVDLNGNPTADIEFNPNNSAMAIEGILSPDGRVLGKMGHSERISDGIYRNVPGNFDMGLFDSLVEYYK